MEEGKNINLEENLTEDIKNIDINDFKEQQKTGLDKLEDIEKENRHKNQLEQDNLFHKIKIAIATPFADRFYTTLLIFLVTSFFLTFLYSIFDFNSSKEDCFCCILGDDSWFSFLDDSNFYLKLKENLKELFAYIKYVVVFYLKDFFVENFRNKK